MQPTGKKVTKKMQEKVNVFSKCPVSGGIWEWLGIYLMGVNKSGDWEGLGGLFLMRKGHEHEPRTASISLLRTSRSSGLSGGGSLNDSRENEMTHRKSLNIILVGFFVLMASAPVAFGEENDELLNKAKAGDADAQVSLGFMYDNGIGVAEDDVEAVKWYRKAAEQGNAKAQNNLGVMYEKGKGVAEDDAEAVKWYRKAAEQGDANAQHNLGVMYDHGEGVAQDAAEATRWFRKAAEQGFAAAQFNLGVSYAIGEGVTQDDAEAVKWYRKAAEQGFAEAQNNLAVMYSIGQGVEKDDAEAVKWFQKAAEQGYENSQKVLRRIEEQRTGRSWDSMLAYFLGMIAPLVAIAAGICLLRTLWDAVRRGSGKRKNGTSP